MASQDLVTGQKQILLEKIAALKAQNPHIKWRKQLKILNPRHESDPARNAWENIRKKSTGNEWLRLILADMEAIVSTLKTSISESPPDPKLRERMISGSLENLKSLKRTRKPTQTLSK